MKYKNISKLFSWNIIWFFDFSYYIILLFIIQYVHIYILKHNVIIYNSMIYTFLVYIVYFILWFGSKNKVIKQLFSVLFLFSFFFFSLYHLKFNYIYIFILLTIFVDILVTIFKKKDIIKNNENNTENNIKEENNNNWNIIDTIKNNWNIEIIENEDNNWEIWYNDEIFVKDSNWIKDKIDDLIWDYI